MSHSSNESFVEAKKSVEDEKKSYEAAEKAVCEEHLTDDRSQGKSCCGAW